MLNDESSSLRISGSPVHRRISKPNLADLNPPLSLIAKYMSNFLDFAACSVLHVATYPTIIALQAICSRLRFVEPYILLLIPWPRQCRRYVFDWLAILLLTAFLVVTELMQPFQKTIYHVEGSDAVRVLRT